VFQWVKKNLYNKQENVTMPKVTEPNLYEASHSSTREGMTDTSMYTKSITLQLMSLLLLGDTTQPILSLLKRPHHQCGFYCWYNNEKIKFWQILSKEQQNITI